MNSKLLLALIMLITTVTFGQKSPAETAKGTIESVTVEINYSSPRVRDRVIYGNLVPYGKVWRAGANENTTVEFDKDVKIDGQDLAAGKYGFFIIPNEDGKWTAIFSTKNDAWGSSSYKESEDALRLGVIVKDTKNSKEEMTFEVSEKNIQFIWADKTFKLKVI